MAKQANSGAANLIPPVKGEIRNPNGRPKGIPNTATRLKRFLEITQNIKNPITGTDEDITVAEQLDLAMIAKARKGDVKAFNALMDRMEGKAPQYIEQNIKGDITSNTELSASRVTELVDFIKEKTKDSE